MRARMTLSIIVASLLATAVPAAASKRPTGPTHSQISAAVARVKRSRNLWATVNICNTKRHPDVVGIRGQMPALGFSSALSMQVDPHSGAGYWQLTGSATAMQGRFILLHDGRIALDGKMLDLDHAAIDFAAALMQAASASAGQDS